MRETLQLTEVLSDHLQLADLPEVMDLFLISKKVRLSSGGFSMYPTLRPGDLLEIDPAAKETLQRGDLIVFHREKKVVCHRLVEISEEGSGRWYRTQGDASRHPDPPLLKEEILGKVISIERRGRRWVPSRDISKPSFGDTSILLFQKGATAARTAARTLLLFLQSFRRFRTLYRFLLGPRFSYFIGVPTSSHPHPRFWRYLHAGTERHPQETSDGSSYRFLAKRKEHVVGSLEITLSEKEPCLWSVTHLFVKTRYRGCGIATALLQSSLQHLRKRELFSILKVEIPLQNRPALSFFRRLGFSTISEEGPIALQKELPFSIHHHRHEGTLQPFLYHLLSSQPYTVSPPEQMEHFKESFMQQAARQLLLEQALFEIDTAFKEKGVDYLVLKGMALAYLLYPDPATRPMGDIDLYLRRKDMPLALAALKNLGYSMYEEEFEKELSAFSGEFAFHQANRPLVELHTSLEQYERLKGVVWIDEEALWKRAISYPISGKTFKALCPEHQLLSLSIHLGLVHRFQGLKWFLDIDRLIMTFGERLNWEELLQTAKRWKVERVVAEVLLTTEELFNTPMPSLPLKKRPSFMRKTAFQWLLLDHPLDQTRVLFRAFFPSRAWLIYRYRLRKRNRVLWYRFLHPLLVLLGKTR